MAKKKKKKDERPQGSRVIQHVGGSYIEGNVSTGGGDFVGRDKTEIDASQHIVHTIFETFYTRVDSRPDTSEEQKAEIKGEIQALQAEAEKVEAADKRFIQDLLKNLQKMAPDIWEVVVATLANPIAGINLVVSKIAKKAASFAEPENTGSTDGEGYDDG